MYPYERINGPVDYNSMLALVDSVIANGWSRGGSPIVDIVRFSLPWKYENDELRTFNYELHSMIPLEEILHAHSFTKDLKYLEICVRVFLDWIDNNLDPMKALSPMAWNDMAVGLRTYKLAYVVDAAKTTKCVNQVTEDTLWHALLEHARWLLKDENIRFNHNHGLYQVAGQLAMSRRFLERDQVMRVSWEQGQKRIGGFLKQQFSSEGVHREHSPGYHYMVCKLLNGLLLDGLLNNSENVQLVHKIEKALAWFIQPDLTTVNFGDTDIKSICCKPEMAKQIWRTQQVRYWSSGLGGAEQQDYAVFPESGYWICRPVSVGGGRPTSYLALNAAYHSNAHKHADDLSFNWYDSRHPILIDSGRYGYLGKTEAGSKLRNEGFWYSNPWRIYCETTRAHNTLEFDGKSFSRSRRAPFGSALKRYGREGSIFFVEAECVQFNEIVYNRILIFHPGAWLIVLDRFQGTTKHNVCQWFHLHPEWQVQRSVEGYSASCGSDLHLRITLLISGPRHSDVFLGNEQPFTQGWWSPGKHKIEPAPAFCYELNGYDSGAFATIFSLGETLNPDFGWSRLQDNGKSAKLRWEDDQGSNLLTVQIPDAGDISIDHVLYNMVSASKRSIENGHATGNTIQS